LLLADYGNRSFFTKNRPYLTVSSWRRSENADAPDGRSPVDWTFVFQKATDRYTIDSGMTHAKKALVDGALILLGAGITILFVSTDGNGQNPVPVAGQTMVVVLVNGLVSFLIARFICKLPLAIIASAILTDMLFIVYCVRDLAYHSTDKYAGEAALMFPIIFTVETAPTMLLSSIGFGRLASRFWRKRKLHVEKDTPDLNDVSADMK
jgi:hypothetical protein